MNNYREGFRPTHHTIESGNETEVVETDITRTLLIGDKFWSLLRAKVGSRITNPGQIDIVFKSTKPSIQETLHRIKLQDPKFESYPWLITGSFDITDGSVHFNIDVDDVPKEELARVISHELVHYLQDEAEKYPDMGTGPSSNDDESSYYDLPWEKEAYRLQELLYPLFLENCSFLETF